MSDHDAAPPQRELAIELGLPTPRMSKSARAAERSGGYGLRVDEYGYQADGTWHVELDGGLDERRWS